MPRVILSNDLDLPIPTEYLTPGKGGSRLVEFGVELEGFVPLKNIGHDGQTDISPSEQHARLAEKIQAVTQLATSAQFCHVHRQGWKVKSDKTIKTDYEIACGVCASASSGRGACKAEVMSPVLHGSRGISEIVAVFDCLHHLDFQTNKSCALHLHVSLGWGLPIKEEDLQEIKNIYTAFTRHQDFFQSLVADHRHSNPHCYPNRIMSPQELSRCASIVDLVRECSIDGKDRRHMMNLRAALDHGTIEYKMREADNFRDAIGYIRFLVAFTCEAAKDPQVTPEFILEKYFASVQQLDRDLSLAPGRQPSLSELAT